MLSALVLSARAGLAANSRRSLIANTPCLTQLISQSGYKSSISLDKLYPKSKHDYLSQAEVNTADMEKFTGFIPIDKLQIKQQLSSKPGGQHVNKTNSSVEVRFQVETAEWIPKWIRDKLVAREFSNNKKKHANRLTKDGYLIVRSEKTRKALLNQADCLDQIREMIFEAAVVPRGLDDEEKAKIETDKRIADGRRLMSKRKKSEFKTYRRGASAYDAISDNYTYR